MLIDKPLCSFTECRKNFDHNCLASGGRREGCEFRLMEEAVDKAIKMLTPAEYEDRDEKGCGWCNKGYRFEFNWIDDDGSTITTNDNMVIGDIADFCPMCGKKLTNK